MATQPLTLTLLTIFGIVLSGFLTEDKLPAWAKSLIAAISVFLAAIVYAAITGQLTSNFTVTFAAVSAIIGWLMVGPLAPVHDWLAANVPGPLAAIAEALSPVPIPEAPPTTVTSRPLPRLALPTTPDMITRNSMLAGDPTWRPTTTGPTVSSQPLQVPSVDPSHASTGPLPPINGTGNAQTTNGSQANTQAPSVDQGGQGLPPHTP